jgi:hypothetical protein
MWLIAAGNDGLISIPLPRGRHIVTLEDAAKYIQKLPKAEQELAEWQAAVAGTAPGRRK